MPSTVTTNKVAYAPTDPALMTGSGFQANEVVDLSILRSDGTTYTLPSVTDDASGNFTTNWTVPNDAPGYTFTVTATGEAAGDSGQATFTGATTYVYALPTDYAPGQTANLYAGGFSVGEAVDFQVTNLTTGTVYQGWSATDGSSSDLDGATDGKVQTGWLVPSDAANCTLQVTATGESSGLAAENTFTDATTPLPLRSDFTVTTNNGTTNQTVDFQTYGNSLTDSAFSGTGGHTFTFFSPALTAPTTINGNPKEGGDFWVKNTGSASFTAQSGVDFYDYNPATASATAIGSGTGLSSGTSITASQAKQVSAPNVSLGGANFTYTVPTGHQLEVIVTINISGTSTTGTLEYNAASGNTGDSVAYLPQTTSLSTWNFGNFTSTVVGSAASPSIYGNAVTFTATVTNSANTASGTPTGSVAFSIDGGAPVAGTTLTGTGNTATSTITISTLTAGSHTVVALYSGTGSFSGSTSSTFAQTVNKASTTTMVSEAGGTYNGGAFAANAEATGAGGLDDKTSADFSFDYFYCNRFSPRGRLNSG